ncbi:hypothetical protein A2U01_0039226, partial [Trifolium medium]|nr:hypothetical protein [Trifolium medium]
MLGTRVTLPSDTAPGYMAWYFKISHPYIIPISEGYSVRLAEPDVAVQEEAPTQTTTHLLGRLASIRDILE